MFNFDFLEMGLGLVSPPHFVYDFFKKNVFHVTFYKLTKFHCFAIVCFPGSDIINFEINHLSNQAIFLHDQKDKTKHFHFLKAPLINTTY